MGLRRLVAEEDFQAPPKKLYKIWKETPHHMPNVSPKNLQAVEHHDGDWKSHGHGSVKTWNYTCEGKVEVFKERVEFDDANFKVTLIGVGGDVFKFYKSFQCIWHFIPKGSGTLARITVEYEKLSDDMPDAINYLNFIVDFHRDTNAHLTKA
ncbi:hypothetical protein ACFE04_029623 [Oxalis oulophora]